MAARPSSARHSVAGLSSSRHDHFPTKSLRDTRLTQRQYAFGKPIAAFQGVSLPLTEHTTLVEVWQCRENAAVTL